MDTEPKDPTIVSPDPSELSLVEKQSDQSAPSPSPDASKSDEPKDSASDGLKGGSGDNPVEPTIASEPSVEAERAPSGTESSAGQVASSLSSFTPAAASKEPEKRFAVPRLDQVVIKALADNFAVCPALDKVPAEYQDAVVAMVDLSKLKLDVASKYIRNEKLWKRMCEARWQLCKPQEHGNSWKRMYLERHLQALLEDYVPSKGDLNLRKLVSDIQPTKSYAHTLRLSQLPSHLDLFDLIGDFPQLSALELSFGARKVGMSFDKSTFGMHESDATSIGKCLQRCRNISRLSITESLMTDDHALSLFDLLTKNNTLTYLDLSHNKLGDRSASKLARLLEKHVVLSHVILDDNAIGEAGAKELGDVLTTSSLRHLSLRLNAIGDDAGRYMLNALVDNKTLTSLNLSNCEMGLESGQSLLSLLRANATLSQLRLGGNQLFADDGAALVAVLTSKGEQRAPASPREKPRGEEMAWPLRALEIRCRSFSEDTVAAVEAFIEQQSAQFDRIRRKKLQRDNWDAAV